MDAMGDADGFADDEELQEDRPFLTPEGRAFTGAGLVLAALLSSGLFQFLSYFMFNRNGSSPSPTLQYVIYGGPSGAMAAAGAAVAWPVRRWTGSRAVHGLAVAAVVVGIFVAVVVAAGIVVAATVPEGAF